MSGGKLPEGWVTTHLSEICSKPQYGYTTKSSSMGDVQFLRTTDITKGVVDWTSVPYCMDAPEDVSKYQLQDRDIVISRAGSVGFSFLVQNPPSQVVFASYLIRFKPVNYFSEYYLKRFLESSDYWNQLSLMSAGNAVQNVNAQKLSTLTVPIAPIAEQKIIAEKLDTLLAQVDSTKARLEQIPQILKRFRQAVLTISINGKLTEMFRAQHKLKDVWVEMPLEQLACSDKYSFGIGPFGSNLKVDDYKEEGHPLIFVRDIRARSFGNRDTRYVESSKFEELRAHRAKPGDLLITKMGEPPGDVAIYPYDCEEAVITADCIKLRVNNEIAISKFMLFTMMSNEFREKVVDISAGVAQQKVNLKNFRKLQINVPSLLEQQEIVRRVEQLFAWADTIEKQVNNALTRVNSLTQSILAKAFRGDLTAQWRAENPDLISGENSAAALLEKIKAERAASGGKKTSRKKA
ncbi:restriction endonuclease subunit S [Salmonella enterica]|uniref:restriction endonuclease subunit S n=1 Tax=Salmonella enterica TaxID=28901 RepID=UPI001C440039|nr:restriction endonuclease subunit S [Salmonella enterica]